MRVIPVLDLKGGTVVRARMGQRETYQSISTSLSESSDVLAVAQGLMTIYLFDTLYVADIDAIEKRGHNHEALARLRQAFPNVRLWVDQGIADERDVREGLRKELGDIVIGSESLRDDRLMRTFCGDPHVILSLDFRGSEFQGPPSLLADPSIWPGRIIVMTLARVGSELGPDQDRLDAIAAKADGRKLFAAGGVRDARDLTALAERAMSGALVASCLHDGRVTKSDIEMLERRGMLD